MGSRNRDFHESCARIHGNQLLLTVPIALIDVNGLIADLHRLDIL